MPLTTLTRELATQVAADYPALQSLSLSSNALSDVRHLQLLPPSLTQLDLGANRLKTLPDALGVWLPELRLLRLRFNALESLRPLVGCKQLQTLDVGANRLALVSELRFLQPLTQLRHLSLDGNPVASSLSYRREVLSMLPQLQSLDGQEFTAAEKLYAKLQLKTQATRPRDPSPTPSPAPSPTRLLTPDSLRTQGNWEQDIETTMLRVDMNGGERRYGEEETEERRRREDDEERKHDRMEVDVSDAVRRQPSPLVLASGATPPKMPSSANPEIFLQARRPSRRDGNNIQHEYVDSFVARDVDVGGNHYQIMSRRHGSHNEIASDASAREALLQNRVEALEAILAVHDKTTRSTLARFGEQNTGLFVKNGIGVVPKVEAAAAVYAQLLAAWREKCVALMVQAQSSELANESRIREYRQQETRICEDLARCEEDLEMWRQRAADFEAQRDLEVVATRQADDRRAQANAKAVQAVRSLALERGKLQHLAETVVKFAGGLVRDKVEQLNSGSVRLEALERRLLLIKERIELAATLVSHREARLRNSEAALEAERRVWTHRLEQMRNSKLQEQGTNNETGGDKSNVVSPPTADGKILRPTTETALRALFHRLDSYDTGLVRTHVLLQALRRGDPGVLTAVGGPNKLSKLVSHVEAAIRKLSLSGGATATLTWGEFLLFFIPGSSVSLAALLQDSDDAEIESEPTLGKSNGACALCTAVKSNRPPSWPFTSFTLTGERTDHLEGEAKSVKKRNECKTLETLSHTELVQQNAILLSDRERLRRLLARDAHDLRDRVRDVRREWEAKTRELARQKDILQRELEEQTEALYDSHKQREASEASRDEAFLDVQRLREQLLMQQQDFEVQKKKLESESAERLHHEQNVWQTEIQDARLAHSLLQADHSKQHLRIRQLERDLARQKEALLAHETERVASLEDKVRQRDTELARLRRERNTILSSLREKEQKLALASAPVEPTPSKSVATQTKEALPLKQRTVASQTTATKLAAASSESLGGRMSIDEISTPNSVDDQREDDTEVRVSLKARSRPVGPTTTHLTPEDVNLRLQKLQSLTESLLAD